MSDPIPGLVETVDVTETNDERIISVGEIEVFAPDPDTGHAGVGVSIPNLGVPTNVANPRRATIRTITQAIIPLLVIVNAGAAAVIAYLLEQTDLTIHPTVFLILNGIVVVTSFVIGLVARIMAIPGVNEFIKRYLPFLAPTA